MDIEDRREGGIRREGEGEEQKMGKGDSRISRGSEVGVSPL